MIFRTGQPCLLDVSMYTLLHGDFQTSQSEVTLAGHCLTDCLSSGKQSKKTIANADTQCKWTFTVLRLLNSMVIDVSVFTFTQVPTLCEDLLSSVDQPLKIARDKTVGKDYLLCDYNRDGDSYR